MNNGHKFEGRKQEFLLIISRLPEIFSTKDVASLSPVKSVTGKFLNQLVEDGYISKVDEYRTHNEPQRFERTKDFPGMESLMPKTKAHAVDPHLNRTQLEKDYWAMRDSFKINVKEED